MLTDLNVEDFMDVEEFDVEGFMDAEEYEFMDIQNEDSDYEDSEPDRIEEFHMCHALRWDEDNESMDSRPSYEVSVLEGEAFD